MGCGRVGSRYDVVIAVGFGSSLGVEEGEVTMLERVVGLHPEWRFGVGSSRCTGPRENGLCESLICADDWRQRV